MSPIPVFFVLVLLHISLSTSLPCSPGTFARSATGSCKPCPRGKYQGLTTLIPSFCRKCPPGTYLPFSGARGRDICLPCPHNTFSTLRGAKSLSSCKPCPTGMVSFPGSTTCHQPCNECQILSPTGCITCSDGQRPVNGFCKIATFVGAVCVKGKLEHCKPGSAPKAFYRFGACESCATGISTDGKACRSCPPGLVPNKRHTKCRPCPIGKGVDGDFSSSQKSVCKDCPPGQNTNTSRPLCVDDGTPCPSNYYEDSAGSCNTCLPGERFNPKTTRCVKCAENEASPGGLSKRCKKCGPNEIGGAICKCRPGFNRNERHQCVPCPAGTIETARGCEDCPIGYSSKPGSTHCELCPPGTAKPAKGKGECVKCEEGLVASVLTGKDYPSEEHAYLPTSEIDLFNEDAITRSACVNPKTNCPPDMRRIIDGAGRFFCEVRSCPPRSLMVLLRPRPFGSFQGRARGCVSCIPGSTLSFHGRCDRCDLDEISDGGTDTECVKCPENEKRRFGKCVCGAFSSKVLFRNASGSCELCPAGTMLSAPLKEIFKCTKCPKGSIASERGTRHCDLCEKGTVERDRVRCDTCPEGFTSYGVGDTECVKIGGSTA